MKKYIVMFGLTLVMGLFMAANIYAQAPTWYNQGPWTQTDNQLSVTSQMRVQNNFLSESARPLQGVLNVRYDVGWFSDDGAALEMYRKTHTDRAGELRFIYGGGDFGQVLFTHYNGTSFNPKMSIDQEGNLNLYDGNLRVDGKIVSTEIEVKLDVWPDFVFADDYELMSLYEVENYIQQNRHLPNVPSEAHVLENGVNVGEMTSILLQKVEELTLHIIELNKRIEELEK